MIPKPTTRDQARTNAIHAAEKAHTGLEHSPATKYWANVSQAWSAIAETFPIEDTYTYTIPVPPLALSESEGETIERLREGSLVTVHPDYVLEHRDLMRNQFRVESGYVGMAVTLEEQGAVMAMRSGERPEDTTQVLPMIRPVQDSGGVRLTPEFYMILMAIAVATVDSNAADNGVLLIHPEDVESAKTKSVVIAPIEGANTMWKVWLTESGA